jgi:hypothetical protein
LRGEITAMSALLTFIGLLVVGMALGIIYYKYFWISMALIEVIRLRASDIEANESRIGYPIQKA